MESPNFSETQSNFFEHFPKELLGLNELESKIIDEIEKRLAKAYSGENKIEYPFHNIEHSVRVTILANHILNTIIETAPDFVTESDKKAVKIAPAGHDLIIETTSNTATGQLFRFRGFNAEELEKVMKSPFSPYKDMDPELIKKIAKEKGGNEGKSAKEVLEIVNEFDTEGYYDQESLDKIKESIWATYPAVDPFAKIPENSLEDVVDHVPELQNGEIKRFLNPDGSALRFFQPTLLDKNGKYTNTSLAALSLAWSDLIYLGAIRPKDDPERQANPLIGNLPTYAEIGSAEFMETRQRSGYKIQSGDIGIDKIEIGELKGIVKDMIKWLRDQVQFGLWQKANLDLIFSQNKFLNPEGKEDESKKVKETLMKEVFPNFYANIKSAVERYNRFVSTNAKDLNEANMWVDQMRDNDLREFAKKLADDFGYEVRPDLK